MHSTLTSMSSGLTCEHTKWKTQARMSDSPVPQGDVITEEYPIPSQVRSTLLSSSKGIGKTTPYLVIPFPFPVGIRKKSTTKQSEQSDLYDITLHTIQTVQ